MSDGQVSLRTALSLMSKQKAAFENQYRELIQRVPLPSTAEILGALSGVNFSRRAHLLELHPGSKLFGHLQTYERSFRMLISFYDDLTGAHGRFQGQATAGMAFT